MVRLTLSIRYEGLPPVFIHKDNFQYDLDRSRHAFDPLLARFGHVTLPAGMALHSYHLYRDHV